jgi:hypothetical protein
MDSDEIVSCTDAGGKPYRSLKEGLSLLSEADRLYGHNCIGFDIPVLNLLYPKWSTKAVIRDTLLIAQMRWAHIKDTDFGRFQKGQLPGNLIGSHKLEAWGYRLGIQKVGTDIEDWSHWTPLMQSRCESDTWITKSLVQRIRAAGVPMEAVETEHELAEYLRLQEDNGWPFDLEAALAFTAKLQGKREKVAVELKELFPPWEVSTGMFTPKRDNRSLGYKKGVPVERFKTVEFNPGSRPMIAKILQEKYGWKPKDFTPGGQPEVSEEALLGLTYPPVPKLREYLLLAKRLSQIAEGPEAWIRHAREEKPGQFFIHHRVKSNGTITHRAAHYNPNLGQVPTVDSPFGIECRSLFTVPKKTSVEWVELGADVSGLELRCLAHYMARFDDGAYGVYVLAEKPNDIHTLNANILGISRADGKTFIYAFLYGGGDGKLGLILAPGKSEQYQERIGKKARKHFLKELPALSYLIDDVRDKAKRKGYLRLIDRRRVYIRSEHAALNSLLQGTGAVICKRWIVHANREMMTTLGPQGWDGKWAAMGWIHDEVQLAVRERYKQVAADIWLKSIRGLQDHYNFRLPLDGEVKFGGNWAECH